MNYKYQAFGIPIISEIALPALFPIKSKTTNNNAISVNLGIVKDHLEYPALISKPFTQFNETELRFELPNVMKMYVNNGNSILFEPIDPDLIQSLIYIYARGLAAILLQRSLLTYHVSGVFIPDGRVVLFAAPSRIGKSTTAIKLQELGYTLFTDDTAIMEVKSGVIYATASYPMTRLWQSTLDYQELYNSDGKKSIYVETDKYGFDFHENFEPESKQVAAIVFLNEYGSSIQIEKITKKKCFENLMLNIYCGNWIDGMNKQKVRFNQLSQITNHITAYSAVRPKNKNTFDSFAKEIENQIINNL